MDRLEAKLGAQLDTKFVEFMVAIQSTGKKPMQEEGSSNSTHPPL